MLFHLKGLILHKLSFVKSIIVIPGAVPDFSHPPFPFYPQQLPALSLSFLVSNYLF